MEYDSKNSYKDKQICPGGTTGETLLIKQELGISRLGICKDDILWFEGATGDFMLTDFEGEIKINRDDVEDTSSNYKLTTSGQIEQTRKLTIKPQFGSHLIQKLTEILNRDTDGSLIKQYADGGFHMRTTFYTKDYSFVCQELNLNMKADSFPDIYAINYNSSDISTELSFLIERKSFYEIYGTLPTDWSIPNQYTAPTYTSTHIASDTDLSITSITLIDPDNLADTNSKPKVQIYTSSNELLDELEVVNDEIDYTFDIGTLPAYYLISYNIGNVAYFTTREEIEY